MLFEKAIVKVLRSLSFLCFAVMIVVVFAQVILRYFFGAPLAWSDELARLLLVWVSFMGVTLVHYSDAGHPAVTFVIEKFPEAVQEIVGCVLNIAIAMGFLVIFKASLDYTLANQKFVSAVLHYPNAIKYAVVPICMLLMAAKGLIRSYEDVQKLRKKA